MTSTAPAHRCAKGASMPACERVPPAHAHSLTPAHLSALLEQDDLPLDPRRWCRAEVGAWVRARGGRPDRFPMNGKALCLMTKEMFVARVPAAGASMYQEFRRRLARALALQDLMERVSAKLSEGKGQH